MVDRPKNTRHGSARSHRHNDRSADADGSPRTDPVAVLHAHALVEAQGLYLSGRYVLIGSLQLTNPKSGISKLIEYVEVTGVEPAGVAKLLTIGPAPRLSVGATYLFPTFATVDPETIEIVHVLRPNAPILRVRVNDN